MSLHAPDCFVGCDIKGNVFKLQLSTCEILNHTKPFDSISRNCMSVLKKKKKFVVVAGTVNAKHIIDVLEGKTLESMTRIDPLGDVTALVGSPDEKCVFVGGTAPNKVRGFRISTGACVFVATVDTWVDSMLFLSSGLMAVGLGGWGRGVIEMYELSTKECTGRYAGYMGGVTTMLESDDHTMLVCGNGHAVYVFPLNGGFPVSESGAPILFDFPVHCGAEGVTGIASLTRESDFLVSVGGSDCTAHVFNLKTLAPFDKEAFENPSLPTTTIQLTKEAIPVTVDPSLFPPTPVKKIKYGGKEIEVRDFSATSGNREASLMGVDCGAAALCVALLDEARGVFGVGCADGVVRIFRCDPPPPKPPVPVVEDVPPPPPGPPPLPPLLLKYPRYPVDGSPPPDDGYD